MLANTLFAICAAVLVLCGLLYFAGAGALTGIGRIWPNTQPRVNRALDSYGRTLRQVAKYAAIGALVLVLLYGLAVALGWIPPVIEQGDDDPR